MGFATLVIGGFASSSRPLSGGELYGFLVAFFAVGAIGLWSFLLWVAVACKILLCSTERTAKRTSLTGDEE